MRLLIFVVPLLFTYLICRALPKVSDIAHLIMGVAAMLLFWVAAVQIYLLP